MSSVLRLTGITANITDDFGVEELVLVTIPMMAKGVDVYIPISSDSIIEDVEMFQVCIVAVERPFYINTILNKIDVFILDDGE